VLNLRKMRHLPDRADVVVIGAGAAGVSALRDLVGSGLTAIGLEARNRIGGRILTRRTLARHPIELGAEFVHGTDNILHQLAAEFGLTLIPHVGEAYSGWDGQLVLDSQLHWPTSLARRRGQRHLLTHLVGGDAADRFAQHPDPPQAMLNQLVHMFGNQRIRNLFVRAEWRVWHADQFSRSGYSAFPDDADEGARQTLGLPVSDTLFVAGEAVGVQGRPGKVASFAWSH
jgi:monoamine oxidase